MLANELLGRIGDSMHAGRSYGPAIEHDGCLVIPVAYVFGGGGGGGGTREPSNHESSGGGFGYVSWPIGVYVVKDGDVRWRPVIDIGGLVMLSTGLVRALRGRRRRSSK